MNKTDMIANVASATGLSKADVGRVVDALHGETVSALRRGEDVKFAGFGNFVVKRVAARTGRNPATGEELRIAESQKVKFRPSSVVSSAVNRR